VFLYVTFITFNDLETPIVTHLIQLQNISADIYIIMYCDRRHVGTVLEQHTGRDNSISRQELPGRHNGDGAPGELRK
jgi:hypothetical protein